MKKCNRCNQTKDLSLFSKDKLRKDGHQGRCKACCSKLTKEWSSNNSLKKSEYSRLYYSQNKDKVKVVNAIRYKQNPEKHLSYSKKWREQNPEQFRGNLLKSRFWPYLSWSEALNQYNSILEKQNYSCGICHKHKSNFSKEFAVDHNHETGVVRGLLCDNCNKGLGLLGDNMVSVKNALDYLVDADD